MSIKKRLVTTLGDKTPEYIQANNNNNKTVILKQLTILNTVIRVGWNEEENARRHSVLDTCKFRCSVKTYIVLANF